MYLKKLIAKNKKEEKDGEQKQKIFVHKDHKYINYYTQRKNKDDIMKKYSFYREKNKYILGHKKERKY
jgi:K+/H+ antiporter YhaU regulatory subunit KhtT